VQCVGVILISLAIVPIPDLHLLDCPAGRFVGVAGITGVGNPQLRRQIGTRYPEAMIATRIHAHVSFTGHMAIDAKASGFTRLMKMMLRGFVFCSAVALPAQGIYRAGGFLNYEARGNHCN